MMKNQIWIRILVAVLTAIASALTAKAVGLPDVDCTAIGTVLGNIVAK